MGTSTARSAGSRCCCGPTSRSVRIGSAQRQRSFGAGWGVGISGGAAEHFRLSQGGVRARVTGAASLLLLRVRGPRALTPAAGKVHLLPPPSPLWVRVPNVCTSSPATDPSLPLLAFGMHGWLAARAVVCTRLRDLIERRFPLQLQQRRAKAALEGAAQPQGTTLVHGDGGSVCTGLAAASPAPVTSPPPLTSPPLPVCALSPARSTSRAVPSLTDPARTTACANASQTIVPTAAAASGC